MRCSWTQIPIIFEAWMILFVTAISSCEGETSPDGWLCARMSAEELDKMTGLSTSLPVTVADDTSPVDTIFNPMISFLAFNMSTQNCSLSAWPWVSIRDLIKGWAWCGIVQSAGFKRQLVVFDESYSVGWNELGTVRIMGRNCEKILLDWSGDFIFQVNHLLSNAKRASWHGRQLTLLLVLWIWMSD